MPKNSCIMQIWAESGKSALPICNYSQILYQFLTFTQNLKRSRGTIYLNNGSTVVFTHYILIKAITKKTIHMLCPSCHINLLELSRYAKRTGKCFVAPAQEEVKIFYFFFYNLTQFPSPSTKSSPNFR